MDLWATEPPQGDFTVHCFNEILMEKVLLCSINYWYDREYSFDVHMSVHCNYISKVQPTRCNVFSVYFYKFLYMFHVVPPHIIRSTKLYIQRQVLSNQYCCLLLSWMRWNVVFLDFSWNIVALHVSGGSSTHHQEHKAVHEASGIVRPILLPAAIVDEMGT